MANPQLNAGQFANGAMATLPQAGLTLTKLIASIDRYDLAYVAAVPSAGTTGYCVVVKGTPPAGTTTVNVTWTGNSADGTALTPATESYDLIGPPLPPQATSVEKSSEGYGSGAPPAPDPGSNTVQLI